MIRRDATLLQLRKQIKIKTIRELKANEKTETNKRKTDSKTRTFRSSPDRISWKSVWKTYGLKCDGEILRDLEVRLIDVGVRNGTTLTFVKLKGKWQKKFVVLCIVCCPRRNYNSDYNSSRVGITVPSFGQFLYLLILGQSLVINLIPFYLAFKHIMKFPKRYCHFTKFMRFLLSIRTF